MEKFIHVYPHVFVDGTKVGGVSKIDYNTKTVTCFDPETYDPETKTIKNREIKGDICFCIKEDTTAWPEYRHFISDGTNILNKETR